MKSASRLIYRMCIHPGTNRMAKKNLAAIFFMVKKTADSTLYSQARVCSQVSKIYMVMLAGDPTPISGTNINFAQK